MPARTRSILLVGASVTLLGACATTGGGHRAGPSTASELRGRLLLSDGAPVASAPLRLACGQVSQETRSDAQGRFRFGAVPADGECTVSCAPAKLSERVRMSERRGELRLVLPPVHRVTLQIGPAARRITFDETLPLSGAIRLAAGKLILGDRAFALSQLAAGRQLGVAVRVVGIERRAYLPVALRGRAPAGAAARVPLLRPDGSLTQLPRATRGVLLLATCELASGDTLDELDAFATSYANAAIGLQAAAVVTAPCARPSSERASLPLYLAGEELPWALGARSGELVVVDGGGRTLFRRPARASGALDQVKAFLDRSWPSFAATLRISVARAASVREAEADRLLAQADTKIKGRKYQEAHELLDRVLALWPELAEARKQRAITKAHMGDLSGAMREVSWWRTSFGSESADDLLEEVQRCAKVSALR